MLNSMYVRHTSFIFSNFQIASTIDSSSNFISIVIQFETNLTKNHNNVVAIDIVIDVSLNLLFVIELMWFFQRKKRNRKSLEQKIQNMQIFIQIHKFLKHNDNANKQIDNFQFFEFHNFDQFFELHSQSTIKLNQHFWFYWLIWIFSMSSTIKNMLIKISNIIKKFKIYLYFQNIVKFVSNIWIYYSYFKFNQIQR